MKRGRGIVSIVMGVLLVTGAIVLTLYNVCENDRAQEKSEQLVAQLEERIPDTTKPDGTKIGEETETPDYLLAPDMQMPTQNINGYDYIGVLSISACGLELPVISETSMPGLKIAPCRYFGSAYTNDLVIAGHSYRAHFGSLSKLSRGDEVVFTDVDGNVFVYEVVETEVLPPNAVEEMTCGEWDLTLFTCTYGGAQRVTVRCDIKEST